MNALRNTIWTKLDQLSRNRRAGVLICGLVALSVAAAFTAVRVPVPKVHDEFSYLLAADTFANGRLTNDPHLLWEHFESFHVIQQPSYNSKYQPGQGMILALGKLVGGHPIVGAWLASAIAAATVCWMLQGWVPSRWALLGGLLVALHGMIQIRWSLSYWGGSLPMAGGALMFGALPRTLRSPRALTSTLMAVGAMILAMTRPFEGLIVGVCVTVALLLWMFSPRRADWLSILANLFIPTATVLWLGIAALGYYNLQVTGNPLQMPYQVHEAEYGYSPLFLWKPPKEQPEYRHEVMRDFQTGWGIEDYTKQQTVAGWLATKAAGFKDLGKFFLGGALWLPLLMLRPLLAQKRLRFVWIALAVFVTAELTVAWTYPHYFAPIVPLLFLLIVQGMRYLAALPRCGHTWAKVAVPAIVALHVIAVPTLFAQYVQWEPQGWQWQRARIAEELASFPGEHLVLVEYGPNHNGHQEWVYNDANIGRAKTIWARQMTPEKNAQLLRHFYQRSAWLIKADDPEPRLISVQKNSEGEVVSLVKVGR